MKETLILARADIIRIMDHRAYLKAVEAGFAAAAAGTAEAPLPMHIAGEGGGFHVKGASMRQGRHFVALKFNGNFPGNPERGLPTIQGAILLCDGTDGSLLAIIDSIEVTLRRTAAASALAARYLARADSETVLVCGYGEQGRAHVEALADVLPLRRVFAWDADRTRADAFAERIRTDLGMECEAIDEAAERAGESDVVATCTTARAPFLSRKMVRPGTFIAAVGADSPEKSEIEPDLFNDAVVVADILRQCEAMGDLRHAIAAGTIRSQGVHAELAELVAGTKPGRTSADQITLFDSTGTALQDVAAAAMIFERAAHHSGARTVRLGAVA